MPCNEMRRNAMRGHAVARGSKQCNAMQNYYEKCNATPCGAMRGDAGRGGAKQCKSMQSNAAVRNATTYNAMQCVAMRRKAVNPAAPISAHPNHQHGPKCLHASVSYNLLLETTRLSHLSPRKPYHPALLQPHFITFPYAEASKNARGEAKRICTSRMQQVWMIHLWGIATVLRRSASHKRAS